MAEYNEHEYFTDSQEEIAEREAQEALRRTIRTEIRRVQSGAADEDIANDIAVEEKSAEVEKKRKKRSRLMALVGGFITGDILMAQEAERVYNLFLLLGGIFLASILLIFTSLQMDYQYGHLKREVDLLKERAIRLNEKASQISSHSSIIEMLKQAGVEIEDAELLPTKID